MASLLERVRSREPARSSSVLSLDDYVQLFTQMTYNGHTYTLAGERQEEVGGDYESFARLVYKQNGIVAACIFARQHVFAEARFQYQRMRAGRPGDLFGDGRLALLETPWPGGTTGDLLKRMLIHADLAGNAFVANRGRKLAMLRPDWVDILLGSTFDPDVAAWDVDAEVIGYVYHPGGRHSGRQAELFTAGEVAHFAPIPDPEAQFRGMSWITPVVREVMGDKAATTHKLKFFENGATVNMVVKFDTEDLAKFSGYVEKFRAGFESASNAYKTLFLMKGADATPVGADFRQMDFKQTVGVSETRIAAAAGVPPVIVGLSEGLQGSSLNAGNYTASRRRFADGTVRPLWRDAAGALARVVPPPGRDARLWYDDRDIPFLQEDIKDAAEILQAEAVAIRQLTDAGYDPASVVDAVTTGDLRRLSHTGVFSVQLQTGKPSLNGAASAGRALAALAETTRED